MSHGFETEQTVKPAAARTYVRQLCSLGLGGPAIMPELLRALAQVIPSDPAVFTAVTPAYEPVYAILENPPPDLLDLLAQEIQGAFRREMEAYRDWWRHHSTAVVCSCAPVMHDDIQRSDFYHHLWHPLHRHHFLNGLVREWDRPLGTVHLFRARSERPFKQGDAVELARLLPHVAHGMTVRPDRDDSFVDSGRRGHVIVNESGSLTHQSESARQLLCLATHSGMGAVRPSGRFAPSRVFQKLAGALVRIARSREAPSPVMRWRNRWGRFVFRAYRLNDAADLQAALTLITIEHQEPMRLRLMRGLRAFPLSAKEREVCFWLAQGLSQAEAAQRLRIKPGTAKKYADSAYLKLDAHNRAELAQKILSEAGHS